jgi:hypothetical protein
MSENTLAKASRDLTHEFVRALHEGDGCLPEADEAINNASRRVVEAMREEHGEAWLGQINLSEGDRVRNGGKPEAAMWRWDGGLVYNFGSSFVLPRFDAELLKMILERDTAPYTGGAEDAPRLQKITDRVREIGGHTLVWS